MHESVEVVEYVVDMHGCVENRVHGHVVDVHRCLDSRTLLLLTRGSINRSGRRTHETILQSSRTGIGGDRKVLRSQVRRALKRVGYTDRNPEYVRGREGNNG